MLYSFITLCLLYVRVIYVFSIVANTIFEQHASYRAYISAGFTSLGTWLEILMPSGQKNIFTAGQR